jgi:hypothetical protein
MFYWAIADFYRRLPRHPTPSLLMKTLPTMRKRPSPLPPRPRRAVTRSLAMTTRRRPSLLLPPPPRTT